MDIQAGENTITLKLITSIRYLECHTKRQGLELKLACTEIGRKLDNEKENKIWTLCMFSEERVNIKTELNWEWVL